MTAKVEDRLIGYRGVLDADIERAAQRERVNPGRLEPQLSLDLRISRADGRSRGPARSWIILSAAAAVTIAALTGFRSQDDPTASRNGDPSAASTSTSAVEAPPLFTGPSSSLRWQVVQPPARLARGMIPTIVAGPNGFVISAMGLEDGRNIGLMWRSTDGVSWEEADPELFHPLAVQVIGATRTWYFASAIRTEPSPEDPFQLLRSKDGVAWEHIGIDSTDSYEYDVLGDRLVRVGPIVTGGLDDQGIARIASAGTWQTSADGETWLTSNEPPLSSPEPLRAVDRGGDTYFVAQDLAATEPIPFVAKAASDGPHRLANQPTHAGYLTATPLGLVNTVGHWDECLPTTDVTSGNWIPESAQPHDRSACAWEQTISVQPDDGATWQDLQVHGPATVGASPPVSLGNQLVQLLIDPDRHLRLVTSTDGVTWASDPSVDIDLVSAESRRAKTAGGGYWPLLIESNGIAVGLADQEGEMVIVTGTVSP